MSSFDEQSEFLCNTLLIKALLQFLPLADRKKIHEWLTKLQEIEDGTPDSKIRDDYTYYLLINVQNGNLSQPFNISPTPGKLKPLCRILPDHLYEDVSKQIKTTHCKLNKMLNVNNDNYEIPDLKCEPGTFHFQQPCPRNGVTALCAAFSNYEDDVKNSK